MQTRALLPLLVALLVLPVAAGFAAPTPSIDDGDDVGDGIVANDGDPKAADLDAGRVESGAAARQ